MLSLALFMVIGRDDSGVFALQNYEFPQRWLAIKDGIVINTRKFSYIIIYLDL